MSIPDALSYQLPVPDPLAWQPRAISEPPNEQLQAALQKEPLTIDDLQLIMDLIREGADANLLDLERLLQTLESNQANLQQLSPAAIASICRDRFGSLSDAALLPRIKEIATRLLNCLPINYRDEFYAQSILHMAVKCDLDAVFIQTLIDRASDLDLQDKGERTPLALARSAAIKQLLIANGASAGTEAVSQETINSFRQRVITVLTEITTLPSVLAEIIALYGFNEDTKAVTH